MAGFHGLLAMECLISLLFGFLPNKLWVTKWESSMIFYQRKSFLYYLLFTAKVMR